MYIKDESLSNVIFLQLPWGFWWSDVSVIKQLKQFYLMSILLGLFTKGLKHFMT